MAEYIGSSVVYIVHIHLHPVTLPRPRGYDDREQCLLFAGHIFFFGELLSQATAIVSLLRNVPIRCR